MYEGAKNTALPILMLDKRAEEMAWTGCDADAAKPAGMKWLRLCKTILYNIRPLYP